LQTWVVASQIVEQQSLFAVHGLPLVLHVVLSGTQAPFVQLPPQHCVPVVHDPLSGVHDFEPQVPLVHACAQQSVALVQVAPAALHCPTPP